MSFNFPTLYTTIPHDKLEKDKEAYFVKEHSCPQNKYSEDDIIKMLEFLVDNIFLVFVGKVFQKIAGIQMGTNCAPLLADIFLYSYEPNIYSLFPKPAGNSWHLGSISHIGTSMMFCP